MRNILILLILLTVPALADPPRQQFAYLLRLKPEYLDASKWTAKENEQVKAHFDFLQGLQATHEMVLAGRTFPVDPEGFGIVILETSDLERARQIMADDPPVKAGMMTARLFPFKVVLERQ